MKIALIAIFLLTFLGCRQQDTGSVFDISYVYTISEDSLFEADEELFFGQIVDIATDEEDRLYVLDGRVLGVFVFDEAGRYTDYKSIPRGQGPGEAQDLQRIAVASGNIFLTSWRDPRIITTAIEGGRESIIPLEFGPTQIDYRNGLFVAANLWLRGSDENHLIYLFNEEDGSLERSFLDKPSNWQAIALTGNFERIAFTPWNTILYSFPFPYDILEITMDGDIINRSDGHPDFNTGATGEGEVLVLTDRSKGLAVLDTGIILNLVELDDSRHYIDIFDEQLVFQDRLAIDEVVQVENVSGFAGGKNGMIYIATNQPAPTVYKIRLSSYK